MKFRIKSAQRSVIQSIPIIPELQMGRHGAVEMSSLSVVKKCVGNCVVEFYKLTELVMKFGSI